ncbi:MAG: glycosyltransferase [Burkholderiales bacterium PBB6]|nr:MAG: glycosyltransferase [Burkholderiales bacterium PBB6]
MIEVPKRAFDARVMLQGIRLVRLLGRAVGKSESLQEFELTLTRRLGLFDRDFYLSRVDASELGGLSPLRHYIRHGNAAGLAPCPMFNVAHYDKQCPGPLGVNRLLHYGLVGRFKGVSPSPWFDAEYYLRSNPDVANSGLDPLRHFQKWGWRESRSPLPGLDMRRLLAAQPEMRVVKGNALAVFATDWMHGYMQADHHGQRTPRAGSGQVVPLVPQPELGHMLDPALWADVQPRRWASAPVVDVLIPVYSGLDETLRCLHSVLTAPVATPHQVVVYNDAGPVPELNAMLRTLAARGLFELELNRNNQGFVRTVNRGLRLHRERDVVILNSDTEVYNDWLDRLLAHAARHPRMATITPLSNNATICSYPETLSDNRQSLELKHRDIDELAARVNRQQWVDVPTGVGFCMFMRRAALREVGLLDEKNFGRGYGEENDFCQRALKSGWRNALATDVYVRHVGSVSFKGEAAERTTRALRMLEKLHPGYDAQIQRYIQNDLAHPHRVRIDLARLAAQRKRRNVLLVSHNRGGGTERHLLEQTTALEAQGFGVFELRPIRDSRMVSLNHPGMFGLSNVGSLHLEAGGLLEEALRELGIDEIHVHHLIDFPTASATVVSQLAEKIGADLRVAVHDYYMACPRVNMVTPAGRHCGQPDEADCNQCLLQDGLLESTGPIGAWRRAHGRMLSVAKTVVVPSVDVLRRMTPLAPEITFTVEPHEEEPPPRVSGSLLVPVNEPVRVLVVGAISQIKGYDVLLGMARAVVAEGLPMRLTLLGYSQDDGQLAAAGVQLMGRYFDHEMAERIDEADPDIILVPSIWPETYCYVLSGALRSGRRVAVFDLGAQADRVRAHDRHHLVLPLALAEDPLALARMLDRSSRAPDFDRPALPQQQQLDSRWFGA